MSACRVSGGWAVALAGVAVAGWGVAGWLWQSPRWHREAQTAEAAVAPDGQVDQRLGAVLAAMGSDPGLAGVAVGYCVLDENGQELLASPLAHTAMPPASSLKTLTTGAAMELLGPDFRITTTVRAAGAPDAAGVLAGDLVLCGAGDPTLASADLDALAAAVAQAGVRHVNGHVVVDTGIFPPNPLSDHWNWGDVGNGYGVGAYGLNLDHNLLTVQFDPGAQGSPAAARPVAGGPPGLVWRNEVVTGAPGSGDQVVAYSEPYGRLITLRGTVPADEAGFMVRVANPDPPAQAAAEFAAALARHGVTIAKGSQPVAPAGEVGVVLASHASAPLAEIIAHLHQVSDNLEAQCLFITLGRQLGQPPATALRQFWQQRGVPFTALRILDGSGLARANMIRPVDLATVMQRALTGPHGRVFGSTLTEYGPGNRAKVGAMSGVRTEVGFLRCGSRLRVYAIMTNGLPTGTKLGTYRNALVDLAAGL